MLGLAPESELGPVLEPAGELGLELESGQALVQESVQESVPARALVPGPARVPAKELELALEWALEREPVLAPAWELARWWSHLPHHKLRGLPLLTALRCFSSCSKVWSSFVA